MNEVLGHQSERFPKLEERTGKIRARIDELKGRGKDTSALEAALASYEGKVGEAQVLHDEAVATLSTHTGFDADGKVTDAAAARETLKSAGEKMREAHRLLRPALEELLKALREFRRDNRPQPTQQP
jgi:hypothetical protein